MIKIRDISIRNKLIIMQVFTSILVLAIFFTVYVVTDIRSYKKRKVDNTIALARVIATNSISSLEFDDERAASLTLREAQNGSADILSATLLDKDGNEFAKYSGFDSVDTRFHQMHPGEQAAFANDKLYVQHDIVDEDNKVIGKVQLVDSLRELKSIKRSKFQLAMLLLAFAVLFSLLVAVIVQGYISKRLLALVKAMKDAGSTGVYKPVATDSGKDELSTLNRVFNNLMLQVEENQKRKDEFIGIASHELKTPLTTIKGYLDLLNMVEDRQPNKQFVHKSLANVNKLETLIRDLLDVSKIQSGQLELNVREFNIDAMIDDAITSMKMVAETHDIKREGHFNGQMVLADRIRIEQVLTNLLSNAIKYSPGEKKIIVYCSKKERELIIRVRDFGMGVPAAERTNIFERFYRTKDMTITITGFGLGLYICRDIITRHKGKIWIEPEEKGSSFYFSLPAAMN